MIKLDSEHEELKTKVEELKAKIRSLKDQQHYYDVQLSLLYRLKSSPDTKDKAEEQRVLIATLKTPRQLDQEILGIEKEIEGINKLYWEKDFIDEPLKLRAIRTYKNAYCTIKQHPNSRKVWLLYEGLETASMNVHIITNEDGVPVRIERIIQGSDTEGYPTKHIQDIIVEDDAPDKEYIHKPIKVVKPMFEGLDTEYKQPKPLFSKQEVKETKNGESSLAKRVRKIFER